MYVVELLNNSSLEHSRWGFLMKPSHKSSMESLQEWIINSGIHIEDDCSSWGEFHYSQWYHLCCRSTQYIIVGTFEMRFLDVTFTQVKLWEPPRVNHWHWHSHKRTLFIMRGVSRPSMIPSMYLNYSIHHCWNLRDEVSWCNLHTSQAWRASKSESLTLVST
jgi:hypothetical protein